jgi:hypothetical protein
MPDEKTATTTDTGKTALSEAADALRRELLEQLLDIDHEIIELQTEKKELGEAYAGKIKTKAAEKAEIIRRIDALETEGPSLLDVMENGPAPAASQTAQGETQTAALPPPLDADEATEPDADEDDELPEP